MPISLDTYARLLAHLATRRATPIADILAELSIVADELDEQEPALRAQLSSAWAQRRGSVAMKFAAVLGDELQKLVAQAPGPSAAAALDLPAGAPEVALPSFLQPAQVLPIHPLPVPIPTPEPPPVVRPPPRLAGTMDADLSAIVAAVERGALPFSPSADAPPLPGAVPPPSPPSPQRPPPGLTGTVATSVAAFAPATPFASPEAPSTPGEIDFAKYSLELYAAVVGALARGEPREKVLAEYRLTEAVYEQLAHAWSARFQGEPQLQLEFNALARSSVARGPRKG